jgi:hypothetical protein
LELATLASHLDGRFKFNQAFFPTVSRGLAHDCAEPEGYFPVDARIALGHDLNPVGPLMLSGLMEVDYEL